MTATTETLERRLRLAHQARRAKEHQLDGIRRALCDVGVIDDGDPYGHADLEDVIRQWFAGAPAGCSTVHRDGEECPCTTGCACCKPTPVAGRDYPFTSPAWMPGDGYDRCDFTDQTADGPWQCIFRAGHPPHGHTGPNLRAQAQQPDPEQPDDNEPKNSQVVVYGIDVTEWDRIHAAIARIESRLEGRR